MPVPPASAEAFSPRSLCEAAVAASRPQAAVRGLDLSADIPAYLPERALGDREGLRALLAEALSRAIATAPGPALRFQVGIESDDAGGWIFHCEIEGTGPEAGLDPARAEALGGGAGVDARPGKAGRSWFTARLGTAPAASAKAGAESAAPPAGVTSGSSPKGRILICEDNPMNQKVIRVMLEHLGHASDLASNGEEALAALARGGYEVVFMDCQMPVMDGYEATRRIRATPGLKESVVIAMTAHAMLGDREKCLEAGMDDYISKPISFGDLERLLRKWTSGLGVAGS
jgi:CheY-like chemotaxis protein